MSLPCCYAATCETVRIVPLNTERHLDAAVAPTIQIPIDGIEKPVFVAVALVARIPVEMVVASSTFEKDE